METLAILVLAVWLSAADAAAIEVRKSHGFKLGLMAWLVAVLVPLVGAGLWNWKVSFGAALLATVLSALAHWCKRQERLGARASKLYLWL